MATPPFLIRLMGHTALSRSFKIGEEDREAYAFANDLRAAVLEGRLSAVWTHPANELAGVTRATKRGPRALPQAALARALGMHKGTSDYLFLHRAGSMAIEFKSAKGSLTQGQRDFRSWCEQEGVPFHVVRSAAAGLDLLRSEGLLK